MWTSFRKAAGRSRLLVLWVVVLCALAGLLWTAERQGRLTTEPVLHLPEAAEVSALAFSPDGRTLAVGSTKGIVRLWDMTTGAEQRVIAAHTDVVWSLAFSPDGQVLASGSRDTTVRLWSPAAGQELGCLSHGDWVHYVAFAPDGRTLAVAIAGAIQLRDLPTGAVRMVLREQTAPLGVPIAFSADGGTLASTSADGTAARLWEPVTGTERLRLNPHAGLTHSVAFAPNGESLATTHGDGTVRLWRAATGEALATLSGHDGAVFAAAFSPSGQTLATGGFDETVRLWDVESGSVIRTLRGHTNVVFRVAFSPDGRRLASGGADKAVRVWRVPTR